MYSQSRTPETHESEVAAARTQLLAQSKPSVVPKLQIPLQREDEGQSANGHESSPVVSERFERRLESHGERSDSSSQASASETAINEPESTADARSETGLRRLTDGSMLRVNPT